MTPIEDERKINLEIMPKTILKSLFLLLLFVFLFFAPNVIFAKWKLTNIDNFGWWSSSDPNELSAYLQYPSIDLYNYYPHIAYFAGTSLKYAFYDGSSWQKKTLDAGTTSARTGASPSLKIDSQGRSHISYYDVANQDLKYLVYDFKADQIVTTATIDTDASGFTSLVLEPSGEPNISYFANSRQEVKLASHTNLGWSTDETVENGLSDGALTSLSLDSQNDVHLAYIKKISNTQSQIIYAADTSGSWQIETVATTGWASALNEDFRSPGLSLALDLNQQPHIVYNTLAASGSDKLLDLKYASKISGSWTQESLSNKGIINPFALSFDQDNQPHFVYPEGNDITSNVFARTYYSGSWQTEEIDNEGDFTGFGAASRFDALGNLHAVYGFVSTSPLQVNLRYAVSDDAAPQVGASPLAGAFSQTKNVILEANETADIYYTKNGKTPTTKSTKYTKPIKISKPTTLKFFAKDLAGNESEIQTATYIITPTTALYQANRLVNYYKGKLRIYTNKRKFKKSFYPFGKKYKGPSLFFSLGNADGKGRGEILAASRSEIRVISKSGKKKYEIKTPTWRVKVADLDFDGKEETFAQWKNELKIYKGKKKIATLKFKYDWIKDFVVARTNTSKKPRLVVATWDGKIRIYSYKKKKLALLKTRNLDFICFHAMDTNRDGNDEFVLKRQDGIYILNSSFKTIYKIQKTGIVTVADINRDNKLEILISDGEYLDVYQRKGQVFKKISSYSYYLPGFSLAAKL